MATTFTLSQNYKYSLKKKLIDEDNDTFKLILMQSGFTFDPVNHEDYGDVSASELPTAYGYTAGGVTLSGSTVARDDVNLKVKTTFNNVNITVSGGDLTYCAAIIIDTTASNAIVGCASFGGDQTTYDGGVASFTNIEIDGV